MTHLDETTVVALRDGGPTSEYASAHLSDCASCLDVLEASRSRSAALAEALALLDEPVDVAAAKAAVRRRLDERRSATRGRSGWGPRHLGRAAALLLLSAGAVSALTWSPLRDWWVGSSSESAPAGGPVEAVDDVQSAPSAGISVAVPDGRISVIVRGATPGSVIEVVWVDDRGASVSAAAGSGYTYADGRAEVDAASGPIRVELPRTASLASLEVDGRVYLRRSAQQVVVPGPVVERSDDRLRFVVPQP